MVGRSRIGLVGRMSRRNEQDAVQLILLRRLACDGQMGAMNGIESTAKDRELQSFQPITFARLFACSVILPEMGSTNEIEILR